MKSQAATKVIMIHCLVTINVYQYFVPIHSAFLDIFYRSTDRPALPPLESCVGKNIDLGMNVSFNVWDLKCIVHSKNMMTMFILEQ